MQDMHENKLWGKQNPRQKYLVIGTYKHIDERGKVLEEVDQFKHFGSTQTSDERNKGRKDQIG